MKISKRQNQVPLFEALQSYDKNQYYSFHVPGHKDGKTFPSIARSFFQDLLAIDATEVNGLDDLYEPTGPIAEAQQLLSSYYQTESSYFLVNGTTVGNLTMVLCVCEPGDIVLVQRDSHKSIFNALKLAGVSPVFLEPDIHSKIGLPTGLSSELVKDAIAQFPEAKAMMLTYPNYYGIAGNYKEVIQMAKEAGVRVLVDEAHGAHFKIGKPMPMSTLEMGADMVVHSAHKTLPAMTMGSFLHLNTKDIKADIVEENLEMLQTSSPSYPIMASLDLARSYLAELSSSDIQNMRENHQSFISQVNDIRGVRVISIEDEDISIDPLKVLLKVERGSGFQFSHNLYKNGLYPELCDAHYVLLTLPLDCFDVNACVGRIRSACQHLSREPDKLDKEKVKQGRPAISHLRFSYKKQKSLKTKMVPLVESEGYAAAETMIPYPPGIPILLDGESITPEIITEIKALDDHSHIQGGKSLKEGFIKVYDEIYNTE